ncbi:MAG TPA: hypothetical protein ENI90_00625, partial [Methylothermaceae bacterium]|nr:hypothetical protein [Methylothermaceae bacterium]
QALQTSGDGLQFSIVEQNCLQCGWCVDVCPEDAIDLKPRLLTDKQRRRQPQVLHQQTPFNCLDCGKAFANQRMIEAVLRKIEGHPMFGDARKKRRLLLCDECRVRDIMRDHEM